jgi:hypothetical protein
VGEGVKMPSRNSVATITYRAYFFDHTEFDSSHGKPVKLSLGDIAWPEGLWKGIERMRLNESAKIRIKKKKYGFGRKQQVDKLRFPPGFEQEGEGRTRLLTKGVIYEVKLLGWTERTDLEANGNFLKAILTPAVKKEWEKPTDRDEIVLDIAVSLVTQDTLLLSDEEETKIEKKEIFKKEAWSTNMHDEEITISLGKILETMKRGEKAQTLVKLSFIEDNDPGVWSFIQEKTGSSEPQGYLLVETELIQLTKVEDWFKD